MNYFKLLRGILYLLLLLSLLIIISSCSSTRYVDKTETVIKHDTIKVPVPIISDTLEAKIDPLNDVIHAERINNRDTIIKVQYYPKEKKIFIRVKPDTIIVTKTDTTIVNHTTTITKEPSWLQENGKWILLILTALIISFIIIKWKT